MPDQCVSICGHSAVGKKTLIRKLMAGDPAGLRERFGILGAVRAYGISDQAPGLFAPRDEMERAAEDCVLHFWQWSHDWIGEMRRLFPNAQHRIVLLWRPWNMHEAAFESDPNPLRPTGYRPPATELESLWFREYEPYFRRLERDGIAVELVDASTDDYAPIAWPTSSMA